MANRYRVLNGNWNLADSWSETSGGVGGASNPTSSDDVFFDSNTPNGTHTINVSVNINSIDFTGFDGIFSGTNGLNVRGNVTVDPNMVWSHSGPIQTTSLSSNVLLKTNGVELSCYLSLSGGTFTLDDDLVLKSSNLTVLNGGTFDANNKNVKIRGFSSNNTNPRTLYMGSGLWNLDIGSNSTCWNVSSTNFTFNKGTANIKITGNISSAKTFLGGDLTYNDVWIATTGSGSVSFSGQSIIDNLEINGGCIIKFNNGATITVNDVLSHGTPSSRVRLESSTTTPWNIVSSSEVIEVYHCEIGYSLASGTATFSAINSIDSGNNTGWIFVPIVETLPAEDIKVNSVRLKGSSTREDNTRRGFVYSTSTIANPMNTSPESASLNFVDESGSFNEGVFDLILPTTQDSTYYVRAFIENSDGFSYGDEVSFTTFRQGMQIFISGSPLVDRTDKVLMDSFRKQDNINQKVDELSFETVDFKPNLNAEVKVYYNADLIFGGNIIGVETNKTHLYTKYKITTKDYSHILNRKLVNKTYNDTSINDIIADIIDTYATDFTYDNVDCDFVVTQIQFNRTTVTEALEDLAEIVKFGWYVDYDKDIHFFAKNTEMSPFNLTNNSNNFIWDSLSLSDDFSQIRNRIIVIGGEYESAENTESYVADGEQRQFPLAFKFAEIPVVTVDSVPFTVGVDGLDSEDNFDCFWSFNGKYIRFKDTNYPDIDEVVAVTGNPLLPIVVNVPDQESILEYGVFEHKVIDKKIKSREDAIKRGITELEAYSTSITVGSFSTYQTGLRSGQTININVGDTNESFIIQTVSMTMRGNNAPIYRITLGTTKTQNIISILQKLLRQDEVVIEGITLLELFNLSESMEFTDTLTLPSEERTDVYKYAPTTDPDEESRWNFSVWS
jgi:hypothetical protein